jgi:hypothetical protein
MRKSTLFLAGISAAALAFTLAAAACSTTTGLVETVAWANYTAIPSKDYTVVGSVVIRTDNPRTLNADLMTEAAKLGADDIINIRIDTEIDGKGIKKITAATAVAIKYTETLVSSTTTTTTSDNETVVTTTVPVMGSRGADQKKGPFGLGSLLP